MSSDESTSTQISTFSNRSENKEKLKPHKPEQWEINLIGNFLLDLYHRSLIGHNNEWCIRKFEIRKEYSNIMNEELSKKLKDLNGTADIGTLLHRCGFLLNTPRGSNFFKIKYSALFDYRNNKLNELDDLTINNDSVEPLVNNATESENKLLNLLQNKSNILLEDNYEIDEDIEKISLEYQRTALLKRKDNYIPTNMSCCICQEDFTTMESYEEHIQKHGEESDFEFLNTMVKHKTSLFNISYRLCKNSHYFCFEIETNTDNLIIEKIIIVQSRSFYYVHNMRVPYKCPANGKDRFFVDSHLFTIHVEQPIVLIFHREDHTDIRIIEQHHFMRSEEFPKVQFSINPYRLPNKKFFKPKFNLADYLPTKEIQDALKDDFYHERLMKTSSDFRDYVRNGKNLQPHNIGESVNILLQIEDMDTILQYIGLTQKGVKLRSYGDEYSFRLKPKQRIFIENILSAYDEVILTSRSDISTKTEDILQLMMQNKSDIEDMKNTFVGVIQAVNTGRISFKCNQKINLQSQYTVICRPSRLNFRYQYRSLQLLPVAMDFLKKFLFPAKIIPKPLSNASLHLYNSNINGEQLQAVRNIYEGPRNDATYIIFGPPGTGKTTTLVEGILQLLRKPDTKILVTASSNSACDEIAKRLCKYVRNIDINRGMVRIYSRSSEVRTETIDDELLENSNMYNGQFYPDIEILHEYRVVICTLAVVAKLATGKFGRSEDGRTLYTHLFIDEVAATTEAEALIGITTVLTPKSCLIISGDHKQLGPILKSKRAEELGLGLSLMDRLLARDCYRVDVDTGVYDRTIQTRLIRNYRSHPAIVNLYSGLYYNHSLESYAKKDDVSLCEIWHKSRNKEYPIMFHAIYEPSRTDNQSHSLYNLSELNVVMDYVKDLMYFGINGKPVKESDIGIISPYKKQFKRIQEELNLRKWFGIETGSVETFQGKEKDIIIVSFVRSGTNNLGFLDNPRRLNVTISRPKSLLILIGNPKTLSLNSDFEYIIKECQRNKTFVGSTAPKRGEPQKQVNVAKTQDLLSVLNELSLKEDVKTSNNTNNQEQIKTSNDEIGKKRRRRNGKNTSSNNENNENFSGKKDEKNINKDESDNKKYENNDDDVDESDSDSDDDSDGDSDKALRSDSATNKPTLKKNSRRRRKYKRESRNRSAAKGGKITKQYGKDKQKNVGDNNQNLKSKIDSLLDELPRVPTSSTTTQATTSNFSNPQFSQMQQQFEAYNNLQKHKQHQLQQQQHFNNILQQQQQPPPFNTYNNPYLNHAGVRQPVPPQFHPSTVEYPPQMIQQPQSFHPYATPAYNINGLRHTTPNMSVFQNTTTNNINTQEKTVPNLRETKENNNKRKTSERKNQNRNFTNNKNRFNKNNVSNGKKNNACNNVENPTKKSSKVAANIHKNSTNNNKSNNNSNKNAASNKSGAQNSVSTGAIPKTSNAGANKNKNINSASSTNSITSNNLTRSSNSGSTIKQSIEKKSYEIPSKSYYESFWSENSISSNKSSNNNDNKPTRSTASVYPTIREISSNTTTSTGSSVKTTLTTTNRPTFREISSPTSTSSAGSTTNSSFFGTTNRPNNSFTTNYNNPPTNPYLSSYAPSAPYVNANGHVVLGENDTSSQNIRPVRNISSNGNNSKSKKEDKCCIS